MVTKQLQGVYIKNGCPTNSAGTKAYLPENTTDAIAAVHCPVLTWFLHSLVQTKHFIHTIRLFNRNRRTFKLLSFLFDISREYSFLYNSRPKGHF